VHTPGGPKRRYVGGKTREEVRQKLTEAMVNRDKGINYDDENPTVGDYLDRWLSDSVRGTIRESTYSWDMYLVTMQYAYYFAAYKNLLRHGRLGRGTAENYNGLLRIGSLPLSEAVRSTHRFGE